MLNRQIMPEATRRVHHVAPSVNSQAAEYPGFHFIVVLGLILTIVLGMSVLFFEIGVARIPITLPEVDAFTAYSAILPGEQRDNLSQYGLISIQRTVNSWSAAQPDVSIAPQSGPFYFIQISADDQHILSTTFHTDTLCICELYQRWGEPDDIGPLLDRRSYNMTWYEAGYVVTAVVLPLPGDAGVRVVTLNIRR